MDWQLVATVATAFGAGTVITKVIEALTSWREGRHKQKQDGWTAADKAYRQAQMNAEVLYETRLFCHRKHGTDFKDLPQLPDHLDRRR